MKIIYFYISVIFGKTEKISFEVSSVIGVAFVKYHLNRKIKLIFVSRKKEKIIEFRKVKSEIVDLT